MNKVLCLMGPTASGKTACALAVAARIPSEIINVDSAQLYCGMDIGTAKPDRALLKSVPHHLIDILDPKESYSAAQFVKDATRLIKAILQRNKFPILVGGTMLYFKALQQGLNTLPAADKNLRDTLQQRLEDEGLNALYVQLQIVDPIRANQLHAHDTQRILRALEIYLSTGVPPSKLTAPSSEVSYPWDYVNVAFCPQDRTQLHARIEKRFDDMLAANFIEEVKRLYARGDLNLSHPAIRAVGYRQVWQTLSGEFDFDTMRERVIIATRQLAKRQMTWLTQFPDAIQFDLYQPEMLDNILEKIV